jgi:4-amino-4-deoxy-L-arabinose transferase-like glycosyltransferase
VEGVQKLMVTDVPRGAAESAGTKIVRQVVLWVVSLGVAAGILAFFYRAYFTGPSEEAIDYGQIAYNLSKGRGFVTNNIVPLGLYFWKDVRQAYDLEHGPLYPLYLALVLYRGTQDSTLALGSMIWFMLSLLLVYFVGSRLFNPRVGYWAAAVLLLSEAALSRLAISGVPAAMAGFLLLAACYLLYRPSQETLNADSGEVVEVWQERPPRRSFWAGVVAGAAYLTQISLWVLLIPATVYLAITNPERRGKHIALFLLGVALISLPYWIRNTRLFGNPFFNMRVYEIGMATKPYPGYSLYRQYQENSRPPSPVAVFREHTQQVLGKWSRNLRSGFFSTMTFPHPVVMALAFVGLFIPLRLRALALWRNMVWWTAVLLLLGSSFGVPGANQLAMQCFAPVFALLAVGSLRDLLETVLGDDAVRAWRVALTGVVLVVMLPLAFALVFREPKPPRDDLIAFSLLSQRLDQIVRELKQRNPNATLETPVVGISDVPWRAAWYTHHVWMWLPETPLVEVPAQIGQGENRVTVNQQLPNMQAARDVLLKVEPLFALITPAVGAPPDGERLQGWAAHYETARQFVFQSYFVRSQKEMQTLAQAWKQRRRAPYDPVVGGAYPIPRATPARTVTGLEPPRWMLFVYSPQ